MASPFETFQQRFSGPPLGQYNPFGTANQYASPYAPGAFQPIPATGTPQTPPPTGGGQLGGGNNPPGTSQGGEGGRDNESGRGEGGMPFGHSAIDMGVADELMTVGGLLAPFPVGSIGGLINGAVNANNVAYRDNVLQGLGTPGLNPGQQFGGLLGLNNYGEGHGLLNDGGVQIGGRNYGVSLGGDDPTEGGGVYDGKTTLTVDEAQNRFNTLGPTAPPPGGLLSGGSTAGGSSSRDTTPRGGGATVASRGPGAAGPHVTGSTPKRGNPKNPKQSDQGRQGGGGGGKDGGGKSSGGGNPGGGRDHSHGGRAGKK